MTEADAEKGTIRRRGKGAGRAVAEVILPAGPVAAGEQLRLSSPPAPDRALRAPAFRLSAPVALSYLLLLVIGIQGFHALEHIILVVQVSALGVEVEEAHGLLGARVDFEWLHFGYNLGFLAALVALLAYVRGRRKEVAVAGVVYLALVGAVALQTYHVAEHSIRIVQYLTTDCTPCVGLIGRLVLFIWPHLFFGLLAYIPFVVAYLAYGLHRQLRGS